MASIHWVTLDDKKREKTLITAASNEIREGINNEIRKYLKFENKLKGEEYKHVILSILRKSWAGCWAILGNF